MLASRRRAPVFGIALLCGITLTASVAPGGCARHRGGSAASPLASGSAEAMTVPVPSAAASPSSEAKANEAASSATATPAPDFVPGLSLRTFAPGHYAVDVRRRQHGVHARNWFDSTARASFVLDAAGDGTARACRGATHRSTNDGPKVHTSDYSRQQQGYRGSWRRDGVYVQFELAPTADVCAVERAYLNLAPAPWRLRCVALEPHGHKVLAFEVLACQLENQSELVYDETWGYRVFDVLPGAWLLFSPGNGLAILSESDSVPPPDRPPKLTFMPSPVPVHAGTWAEP